MATASPRSDTSDNHSGRLQLKVTVSSAKLKRKKKTGLEQQYILKSLLMEKLRKQQNPVVLLIQNGMSS